MSDDGIGYLRYPTISGDTIGFCCEDDLWLVPVRGGEAVRLTAGVAEVSHPALSPDGRQVAFVGRDEGPPEVYVIPTDGGPARRLTYQAEPGVTVLGWTPEGDSVLYASAAGLAHHQDSRLYQVPASGGLPQVLPYGLAHSIAYRPGDPEPDRAGDGAAESGEPAGGRGVVLGRYTADPARWKRYRGGTVGHLWVDATGAGEFRRLADDIGGNIASPCWVSVPGTAGTDLADRIWFLSDHEGVGNVYSCRPDGTGLRRHSDHEDFYARSLASDGRTLVYHCAGELYVIHPGEDPARVPVRLRSSRTQRNRRFVPAGEYLHSATLSPDGSGLAVTSRGKAYSFGNWEGPVRQHGATDGVRYRLLTWLNDHTRLVAAASDESEDERLVILTADGSEPPRTLDLDVGRVTELAVSPTSDRIAVANHRNEVVLVDLHPTASRVLDYSRYGQVADVTWSPDGRWLAYTFPTGSHTSAIKLCRGDGADSATGKTWFATEPVLRDVRPAFDPDGRYLYFLGQRDLNPVYDELQFDLGFPLGWRPYAVTLREDTPPPFVPAPRPLEGGQAPAGKGHDEPASQAADLVRIDLDGITRRVTPFPVPDGRYRGIAGIKGKVLFSVAPVRGSRQHHFYDTEPTDAATLEVYDLDKQEHDHLVDEVSDFRVGRDHTTLLYRLGPRLRVVSAGAKPDDSDDTDRSSGWIDLDRVKVSVRPQAEWRQMFREAWRLQREHFWTADMSGVDWDGVYRRYLPLVDRVATRSELSDLLWELQGELGTSHAFERGGEYRPGPHYAQGFLGVDWAYDATGRYRIEKVLTGDPWDPGATSPLLRPGVDIRAGDTVLAINGQPLGGPARGGQPGGAVTPGELLVNQAEEEVQLTVQRGDEPPRGFSVRTLADEQPLRYRDWVTTTRQRVHDRTGGRVGYLHVPDMGPDGYAEFHRGFLTEYDREALIVDVRFNGGGHISGLLLQKLARRRLGYDFPRWGVPVPYLEESPRGPLVAIANEMSASDGDIFSHAFKMLGLGSLVGKRTWGGVIGYEQRHVLADGTITTQPELSLMFDDVGWQVENYGTDPDVEVDVTPQDYAAGTDPQLERAIEVALEQLTLRPAHAPDPPERPRFTRPTLAPRG